MTAPFVLLLSLLFLSTGCDQDGNDRPAKTDIKPKVRTVVVEETKRSPELVSPGTLVSRDRRIVSSPFNAFVEFLQVKPGQSVSPGETIARLNTRELETELEILRQQLARVQTERERTLVAVRQEISREKQKYIDLQRLEIEIGRQRREVESDREDLQTALELEQSGGISEKELSQHRENLLRSREVLEDLGLRREMLRLSLKLGPDSAKSTTPLSAVEEQLRGELEHGVHIIDREITELEIRIEEMVDKIEQSSIEAPIGGRITFVDPSVGEYLQRGEAICGILNPEELFVQTYIPESRIPHFSEGSSVQFQFFNEPTVYEGRILYLFPEIDSQRRSIPVLCSAQDLPDSVKPGAYVEVRLYSQLSETAPLSLPRETLLLPDPSEHQAAEVFVLRDGRVFKARLKDAQVRENRVVFSAGLSPGDTVVLQPPQSLREGASVEIIPSQEYETGDSHV